MSHGKQFTLYSHKGGPNGWKIVFALEYLGLSYETVYLDFHKGEHKGPEYTKYNPNGRIPTIIDHKNKDFVLWESGAILVYLVDKYDADHRLSAATEKDKYLQLQWLFFQASGQGPYFGQAAWFSNFHPEKVPSAVERYQNEIKRVLGVLDSVLREREWLVGDKMTVADIAFITWNSYARNGLLKNDESFNFDEQFPAVAKWHQAMTTTPVIKNVLDHMASLR
ncbi:glutathione S-transferase C-terminal-like protein [Dacryopinax primogenitus]|uniref:glutathione transferase n=1 Tax=Dacryopinax primogenitus (strain DJM 731) TaxID=1858805 RepID=M5G083_DACPD|nr:glutathione S-transferase C-terminal-like protein [Dacryopinax primogenitus]EJT99221.1 glutathione S-transferase C-terminal-like protein [Dacryopinax primogenitus]